MVSEQEVREFIGLLEGIGYSPGSYSGRGMFGKHCVSVTDVSAWEVARNIPEELNIPEPNQDAVGLGNVLYWPSYEWPKDLKERTRPEDTDEDD